MIETPLGTLSRKLSSALHRHVLVNLPRRFERSDTPVTLVIPLAEKDLAQARATIAAARRHLLHPIAAVIIPGQSSAKIARFCTDVGAMYIDETDVLPECIRTLHYVTKSRNRNGWIRQQILKLMVDRYIDTRHAVILDADTCLVRNLSYMRGGRPILFTADECNPTYHMCNERLIGPLKFYRRSFVAHTMLMDREVLAEIRNLIETRHGTSWTDAIVGSIDRSVGAGFSEYELYGTYMFNFRPQEFQPEYWFNSKVKDGGAFDPALLPARYRKFNFVSRHLKD